MSMQSICDEYFDNFGIHPSFGYKTHPKFTPVYSLSIIESCQLKVQFHKYMIVEDLDKLLFDIYFQAKKLDFYQTQQDKVNEQSIYEWLTRYGQNRLQQIGETVNSLQLALMLHKLIKQKSTMFTNATIADFLALNICVDGLLKNYRYDDYVMTPGKEPL